MSDLEHEERILFRIKAGRENNLLQFWLRGPCNCGWVVVVHLLVVEGQADDMDRWVDTGVEQHRRVDATSNEDGTLVLFHVLREHLLV